MFNKVLLEVRNLDAGYFKGKKFYHAVRDCSFKLYKNDFLGIAGESGCGKSTLALAILRLLKPPGKVISGQVIFDGVDLFELSEEELRQKRWGEFSLVTQSSMNSLNPVLKIKDQLLDVYLEHSKEKDLEKANKRLFEVMRLVNIDPKFLNSYPHQLSGGMRQRVVIAMALLFAPKLIVLDEPTTALDVIVQRSIIEEFQELFEKIGFSAILITHDISLLFEITKHIAIMYAGEIVEYGQSREVFDDPKHPYTKALLQAIPSISGELKEYKSIPGRPPDLSKEIVGCSFVDRCEYAFERCEKLHPQVTLVSESGRWVRCHLYSK
ncbi:ABC transporter ATP-binding protein [Pseudothermotoga thermarum]|uniref:Oligopeptide/dipeptide ABC transporter, ATPase subunit n=1 Tax=Pseudothermotoga thermarum DSM 5069 TaxID=688269 RepID=F7YW60_9THEM|nr:ABC transporter ATP-binding protein [Pseudothermotoga thermarum]AEH51832.1 oligopeptide/dipeptide ABC transporter, ATPase subunit [Pseudothermotoga thermarum DSM 5069]